jgi:hypothetical protein
VEERDSGDRRPKTLSNQAFATGMEACADRRLSDQAVAKGVEAFLDRLLAKQTFGEGFEEFADRRLSNHTFAELNELFTDRLLSDRTAQKRLMHLLTKARQKQTFAEGFFAWTDQGLLEADLRRIGGVHGRRSVRLWSVRSDLQVKFGWHTCVNVHSSLQ